MKKVMALILMILPLLTGCVETKELTDDELLEFLEKCYDTGFEYVTEEQIGDGSHDEKMYTVKSEDGIEFQVHKVFNQGMFGGYFSYCDDYLVQWLLDKPELYQPLMDSDFECEIFDQIGEDGSYGGFRLHPESFDEIRPAAELAHKVIHNEAAVLPYGGYTNMDDVYATHISPEIAISGAGSFEFQTEAKPCILLLEDRIAELEQEYVDNVRSGAIDEQLADEVLMKYGPEHIRTVTIGGEELDLFFERDQGYNDNITRNGETIYYTYEQCPEKEQYLRFPRIAGFAACAGFEPIGSEENVYTLSNGKDTVKFCMSSDDQYILKNDVIVTLQGSCRRLSGEYQVVLTTDDLHTLFGIKTEFDMVNGSAELVLEQVN